MPRDASPLIKYARDTYPEYKSFTDDQVLSEVKQANPGTFDDFDIIPPKIPTSTFDSAWYGLRKGVGSSIAGTADLAAGALSLTAPHPEVGSAMRKGLLKKGPLSSIKSLGESIANVPEQVPEENKFYKLVSQDIPSLVGNIAPIFAMGGLGAAAYFGTQVLGEEYERSKKEGRDEATAYLDGIKSGIISTATAIPFAKPAEVVSKSVTRFINKVIAPEAGSITSKVIPYLGAGISTGAEMATLNPAIYAATEAATGRPIDPEVVKEQAILGAASGPILGAATLKRTRGQLKRGIAEQETILKNPDVTPEVKVASEKTLAELNNRLQETRGLPVKEQIPLTQKEIPLYIKNQPYQDYFQSKFSGFKGNVEFIPADEINNKYLSGKYKPEEMSDTGGIIVPDQNGSHKIVLNSDYIDDVMSKGGDWKKEIDRVVHHEMGHMGIGQAFKGFGLDWNEHAAKINAEIVKSNFTIPQGYDKLKVTNPTLYTEEWILHRFAEDPNDPMLRRALSYIRMQLRRVMPNMKWTDNDIRYMVKRSIEAGNNIPKSSPKTAFFLTDKDTWPDEVRQKYESETPEVKQKYDLLMQNLVRKYGEQTDVLNEWENHVYSKEGQKEIWDRMQIQGQEDIDAMAADVSYKRLMGKINSGREVTRVERRAMDSYLQSAIEKRNTLEEGSQEWKDNNKTIAKLMSFGGKYRTESGRRLQEEKRGMLVLKGLFPSMDPIDNVTTEDIGRKFEERINRIAAKTGIDSEELHNNVLNIPNEIDRVNYLQYLIRKHDRTGWAKDVVKWYMYNNMLSSPITHFRNFGGTAIHMLETPISKFAGLGVSKFIGQDVITPQEIREMVTFGPIYREALGEGIRRGYQTAAQILKHGMTPAQAMKLELPSEPFKGFWPNAISRALTAADFSLRAMVETESLYTSAFNDAVRKGIKPSDRAAMAEYVHKFVDGSDPSMKEARSEALAMAGRISDKAVFRSEPGDLGKAMENMKNVADKYTVIGGTMVMPFYRTTANVVKAILERTALGFAFKDQRKVLGAITEKILGKNVRQINREEMESIARTITGVTGLGLIMGAYKSGAIELTGSIPTDEKEKQRFYAEGKQPNSIKIPGVGWVEYQYLGAIGPAISLAKSAVDNITNNPNNWFVPIIDFAKSISDYGFLSGVSGIMRAINDPNQFAQTFLANTAGMFIPLSGAQRFAAERMDPTVRETKSAGQKIVESTPMLWGIKSPEEIPPRLTNKGEEVSIKEVSKWGVTRIRKEEKDPVSIELNRLSRAGFKYVPISAYDTKVELTEGAKKAYDRGEINDIERYALNKRTTEEVYKEVSRFVNSTQYATMEDPARADAIQSIKNGVAKRVRKKLMPLILKRQIKSLADLPTVATTQ